jgi:uncharacterized membrane protein YkvA (DUF1232 family)
MTSTPFFSHMLNPEMDGKLAALCGDVETGLVTQLILDVQRHVGDVHQALKLNEFLDVSTAERIAAILVNLLGKIELYPKEKQRLIVGATRYFVKNNDAQADLDSLLGFDDDVEVLNFVLVELGQSEKRIKL